jgi:hypothetical protein
MSAIQPKACLDEAQRQAAVLAALRTPLPAGSATPDSSPKDLACALAGPSLQAARLRTDAAGLLAYRVNAQVTSQLVLVGAFPTLAAMLGADTLDALALILWQTQPPERGDLGEWGASLPDLLATHPDLQAWPWLADCARLDWARHLCERAADTTFDADSLLLLGTADPARLSLHLHPHVQVLSSRWPVLALWAAHRLPLEQQAQACAKALAGTHPKSAMDATSAQFEGGPEQDLTFNAGQGVVVWRQGWQVQMTDLPLVQADWMMALSAKTPVPGPESAEHALPALGTSPAMAPGNLADLLALAAPSFGFAQWLGQALQAGWIWRLVVS